MCPKRNWFGTHLIGVLHAKRFKCNVKVGDMSVVEEEGCDARE